MAGITATLVEKQSGAEHQAELWAGNGSPLTVEAAGKQWNLSLRKLRWKLPFSLRLDKFTRELHPRTSMAREYSSFVTKIEGGDSRKIRITMNEPLRHGGYTFYQSSWGPQNGGPKERFYSVFAVVRNPADQIPLVACIIVTIGLVLHFMQRLLTYLRNERAGRKAALQRAVSLALLSAGVLLAGFRASAAEEAPAPPSWDKETLRVFATLPVQDDGRVKPLDTFAAFKLLKFHGSRSCPDVEGKSLSPTAWFINCVFYPDAAKQYKVFRVDNDAVIIAVGLLPKKKRDYYSYAELEPAREKLLTLGRQYMGKEEQQRSVMETELMSLGMNLREFEDLTSFADFARKRFSLAEHKEIAPVFPNQAECRVSDILRKAPDLFNAFVDLKKKSEASAPELKDFSAFLKEIQESAGDATTLALFPPPVGSESKEWYSPADMVQAAFSGETLPAGQIDLLAGFEDLAFSAASPEAFKKQTAAFHQSLVALAAARGEYGKIGLEVFLYRMQPFYNALILYVLSFILVACLWMRPGSRGLAATSYLSILAPTILLAVGITLRCIIRGRPPVTTLYETILFVTAVAVAVSLFMEWVNRQRVALSLASVLGVAGMFLANKYEVREGSDTMVSMVAVLDTNFWLATHVTTITIGYAAGLLSGGLAHVFVLGKLLRLKRNDAGFYRGLTRMVYGSLCFALVFSVVGTVLGGIWANESWGRFWGWDPKENGALMIVLWQLAILHARKDGMLRDYGINLSAILGGIVIAFSWFGVNMLGVGLHSYGFASGAHLALVSFYAFETVVVLLGSLAWLRDHKRETV
jgi:ABC-type transport system involved in cytochrome c biogenesis permease subunit